VKLNLDDYKGHRIGVHTTLNTRGHAEYQSVSSMYAATSACPIFVVYLLIGEVVGYNEWIMQHLKDMAEFYEYTEIVGEAGVDCKQFEVKSGRE
jgi:hypothetical protein